MKAILITGDKEETRILDVGDGKTSLYTPSAKKLFMGDVSANVMDKPFPTIRFELIHRRPNGDLIYRRVK
jgi:hypothetical protein